MAPIAAATINRAMQPDKCDRFIPPPRTRQLYVRGNYDRYQFGGAGLSGRLALDNNKAERALRGIALGRNNWLFCGSAAGGRTAAVLFTLIASAVRNGLDPYRYLGCLLTELPLLGESLTAEQLRPYLPNVWRPPDD